MAKRDVREELRNDVLVDIPADQVRRFGMSGKMLRPSPASVAAAVSLVRRGCVLSITELRERLAMSRGAQTTCPFLTKRALIAIAAESGDAVPYWRIVRADGAMIDYFPGGAAGQARRLKAEAKAKSTTANRERRAAIRSSSSRIVNLGKNSTQGTARGPKRPRSDREGRQS